MYDDDDDDRDFMFDEERGEKVYLEDMREWQHFYGFRHSINDDQPQNQGAIQEDYGNGKARVWLFDWVLGQPDVPEVIDFTTYGALVMFPNNRTMLDWFRARYHPYGSEESACCLHCGERRYQATGSRRAPWDR